jgi:glycosyltransferase involved in cell wall biosynthesis
MIERFKSTCQKAKRTINERLMRSIRPLWYVAAVRCLFPLRKGSTIVIVNWNSLGLIKVTLDAVRRYSPSGTNVIVVDNASEDGAAEWLRARRDITLIELDSNYGHGPALDIGFLRARTRYVIALDVDAFPIADSWIDQLTALLNDGATFAGAQGGTADDSILEEKPEWAGRDFIHPCCCAMRLRRFVYRRHSFRKVKREVRTLDPGELISERESEHLARVAPTEIRGPSSLGMIFGDFVYHNSYGTRHFKESGDVVDGVTRDDALAAWDEAVQRFVVEP